VLKLPIRFILVDTMPALPLTFLVVASNFLESGLVGGGNEYLLAEIRLLWLLLTIDANEKARCVSTGHD